MIKFLMDLCRQHKEITPIWAASRALMCTHSSKFHFNFLPMNKADGISNVNIW